MSLVALPITLRLLRYLCFAVALEGAATPVYLFARADWNAHQGDVAMDDPHHIFGILLILILCSPLLTASGSLVWLAHRIRRGFTGGVPWLLAFGAILLFFGYLNLGSRELKFGIPDGVPLVIPGALFVGVTAPHLVEHNAPGRRRSGRPSAWSTARRVSAMAGVSALVLLGALVLFRIRGGVTTSATRRRALTRSRPRAP